MIQLLLFLVACSNFVELCVLYLTGVFEARHIIEPLFIKDLSMLAGLLRRRFSK